jgi:hypothetical protein
MTTDTILFHHKMLWGRNLDADNGYRIHSKNSISVHIVVLWDKIQSSSLPGGHQRFGRTYHLPFLG